jgi:DNA-binding MarR family transcriptional regulator
MATFEHDAALAPALAARVRALAGKLKRRLREQADVGDLTPSQTSAMIRLEKEGPLTLTALARAEGVRPQSMSATVAALLEAGHVVGAPHPTDGRQTLLALTPACRAWIEAGRAARHDWLVRALGERLTTAEQQRLAEAVGLLERLVE